MTRIENIRDYLYDITNGLVKITEKQAENIIHITESFNAGTVTMFRYDSNNSTWVKHRVMQKEDATIIKKVEEYRNSLNYQFYKYDCTLSTGSFAGTIFSSNNNVFDYVK